MCIFLQRLYTYDSIDSVDVAAAADSGSKLTTKCRCANSNEFHLLISVSVERNMRHSMCVYAIGDAIYETHYSLSLSPSLCVCAP